MANKIYNVNGGKHSAAAYAAFEKSLYGSCVATSSDYTATAGTGMKVNLSIGNGLIDSGSGYAYRIGSDAMNTIDIATSSSSARIDSIVAYVDTGVAPSTSVLDNSNNMLKFVAVTGTPSATPVAPSSATIQSAIGAGNPYMVLWDVTIPANATALTNATFTDRRTIANAVDGANIEDGSIDTDKIDWGNLSGTDLDAVTSSNRLDIGKWHFYHTTFGSTSSGWQNKTLTVPSDFGGHIVDVHISATFGNSGNNYGCTWFNQTANSVNVRFNQGTAGSNGWFAIVIAIF